MKYLNYNYKQEEKNEKDLHILSNVVQIWLKIFNYICL